MRDDLICGGGEGNVSLEPRMPVESQVDRVIGGKTHRISLQEAVLLVPFPSLIVVCTWYGLSCQGQDESRL